MREFPPRDIDRDNYELSQTFPPSHGVPHSLLFTVAFLGVQCLNFFVCSIKKSKRVPVQIRYTNAVGLRPYFLTVAKRLNTDYPDVLVERLLLPRSDGVMSGGGGSSSTDADGVFEVLVDGRVVVRLNSGRRGVAGTDSGMTIFVSMEEVDQAIARARRRRRPSTVFDEGNETNVRLEVLKNKATESQNLKQKDNR